jgi:hypothetical protein
VFVNKRQKSEGLNMGYSWTSIFIKDDFNGLLRRDIEE